MSYDVSRWVAFVAIGLAMLGLCRVLLFMVRVVCAVLAALQEISEKRRAGRVLRKCSERAAARARQWERG